MNKPVKKRRNECQFCTSRLCSNRIVREEEPKYDEVYCVRHHKEAEAEADRVLGSHTGNYRTHISSTSSNQRRGEPVSNWK
jgi:hypothetical protein